VSGSLVEPGDLFRVERWLTAVRGFAAVFAVLAVASTPYFPGLFERSLAWTAVVLLIAGTVLIDRLNRRMFADRGRRWLSVIALMIDTAVIAAFVLAFAFEDPYVTWALVLACPLDGVLRYRTRGALAMGAVAELIFIVQSVVRYEATGEPVTISAHLFVLGLIGLVASATSVLVETWHVQNVAYREQALDLAEAHRVQDRLLAVTSHEFRGSLGAVVSGTQTVRSTAGRLPAERTDHMLQLVENQGRHLLRLVDDLLVSAQVDSGALSIRAAWGDLTQTIDLAIDAASRKRRGHRLELFVDPVRCELDHERLQQIVRNLTENAFKYSPETGTVSVTARPEGDSIELEVTDEGPGIPAAQRASLFQPFWRGHGGGVEGAGLGLYVVDRIVSAMDGTVDLRTSSRGTTFACKLPCRVEAAESRLRAVESTDEAG
jgi:signal transduction histidine kinase